MFGNRLTDLSKDSSFLELWIRDFTWNLRSKKFQAFTIGTFFFSLNLIDINMIDQDHYLIFVGIYTGANILEKAIWKIGGKE